MKPLWIGLCVALAARFVSHGGPASACSIALPEKHRLAVTDDKTPPLAPEAEVVRIKRAMDTGGACAGSSCDDMAIVHIRLVAEDDKTVAGNIGYRVELVSGEAPSVWFLPGYDIRTYPDGMIYLNWTEATEDHAAISLTLRIFAIDESGNVSAPTELAIHHPGDGGCNVVRGGRATEALFWAVLITVFLGWRGRKRIVT